MELDELLFLLLHEEPDSEEKKAPKSFDEWWAMYKGFPKNWTNFDRAVVSGIRSPNVAFAFAGGYQSALHHLVPSLPRDQVVCFCATEEGGAHPKAIITSLAPVDATRGGMDTTMTFKLNGHKRWISLAVEANLLLVVASTGENPEGFVDFRIVQVPASNQGVIVTSMDFVPLLPEVTHGEIDFRDVEIPREAILPGDGYKDFLRPFRTIEDIFVVSGVLGYLLRVAKLANWPNPKLEMLCSLLTSFRDILFSNLKAPSTHIALGGGFALLEEFLTASRPLWDKTDASIREAWQRDSALLTVAQKARVARLQSAWQQISGSS